MSDLGQKQTCAAHQPPKTDISERQPPTPQVVLFRAALAICLANRQTVGSAVRHLTFLRALFKTRLL